MNFFDPTRPRLQNGLPKHLHVNFALPNMQLAPVAPENPEDPVRWEIGVMLPGSRNGYHWVHTERGVEDLVKLLDDYLADPEETLVRVFGLNPRIEPVASYAGIEPTGKDTLSLDDLEAFL